MAAENGAWAGNFLNMEFAGENDRFRGMRYRCLGCDRKFWTCFGHARLHECDGPDPVPIEEQRKRYKV